nr:cyclase family protein [Xianfuyuplasma coldseepsis]
MIYDVSYPIDETIQVYKNADIKKPTFTTIASHETDNYHETNVTLNLHTGTHVDYPLHMIENGATSNKENLDVLLGKCIVLDFTANKEAITKQDLQQYDINKGDFLLFKTKNSFSESFLFDFTYLTEDGARYLQEKKIRGVGTDGLGIERAQEGHPTHKILLSNNIVIIEGLRLKDIEPGTYEMICLPLNIRNVEASLARVILKR